MDGQSIGHQGYIAPALVSPPTQKVPIVKPDPRMYDSTDATTDESSSPIMHVSGYNPYGTNATSASSTVSKFGTPDQTYQSSSIGGNSYNYNYFPSPAAPAYAGVSSPTAREQPSQIDEVS